MENDKERVGRDTTQRRGASIYYSHRSVAVLLLRQNALGVQMGIGARGRCVALFFQKEMGLVP